MNEKQNNDESQPPSSIFGKLKNTSEIRFS